VLTTLTERDSIFEFLLTLTLTLCLNQHTHLLESMNDAVPSFPPLLGYVPRDFIGQGGQSTIYRALNLSTNLFAALKVVPFSLHHQQELQQKQKQLVREMRIHETLKHRNVLRLFGGETRQACMVERRGGMKTEWPMGLYMVLDLGELTLSRNSLGIFHSTCDSSHPW